jgi:hypothetical protein
MKVKQESLFSTLAILGLAVAVAYLAPGEPSPYRLVVCERCSITMIAKSNPINKHVKYKLTRLLIMVLRRRGSKMDG